MPFINLGEKPSSTQGAVPTAPDKAKVYYPSLHIDNSDLGLEEKDVGKELMAMIKLKVRSVEKRMSESNGKKYSCSLEVIGIDIKPKQKNKGHYGKA